MGQASKNMMNMLTEFLVCEIGSKAMDGITYAMVFKSDKDREYYNRYMEIRNEVSNCGFGNDEVFRVYEVSNGYIFDMDLNIAKRITMKLAKAVEKTNGVSIGSDDIIGDLPEKRRKSDMTGLARFIQQEYNSGKNSTEVALFSRNTVPHIMISGKSPSGGLITLKYNSYAIRHWDIETVNSKLLIPAGIRIARIESCEILPPRTGVSFKMYIEGC